MFKCSHAPDDFHDKIKAKRVNVCSGLRVNMCSGWRVNH